MHTLFSPSPFRVGVAENMQDLNKVPKALLKIIEYSFLPQGKFIRINFDASGYISGANIESCVYFFFCDLIFVTEISVSFDMKIIS